MALLCKMDIEIEYFWLVVLFHKYGCLRTDPVGSKWQGQKKHKGYLFMADHLPWPKCGSSKTLSGKAFKLKLQLYT